jgi:hypothetical protein
VAISIDSVGYQEFYRLMFERIGIRKTSVTCEHLCCLDHRRQWKAAHNKKHHIKKRRKMKLNEKIKHANEQLRKDQRKGCTYSSGMAGLQVPNVVDNNNDPTSDSEEQSNANGKPKQKKMKKIASVCKVCHQEGHQRQYSGKCLLSTNLTSKYYKPGNVGAQGKFCTGGLA